MLALLIVLVGHFQPSKLLLCANYLCKCLAFHGICVKLLCFPLTGVWCTPIADNLSQQDAKGPDIRFDCERTVVYGLRGCPFNGELSTWLEIIENPVRLGTNVDSETSLVT